MALTPAEFQNGVEALHGLLVPFDQGLIVDGRVYLNQGACAAFAAVWIRNKKELAAGRAAPDAAACMEEVSWMEEQKHEAGQVYTEFLVANGLRRDGAITWPTTNINWQQLRFFLLAQQAFYFVGVLEPGAAGHAIAFDTSLGRFKLFDPNYGTASFPDSPSLIRFFGAYWPRAYPTLVGHGLIERWR